MIGAPDILMAKDSTHTRKTQHLGVGKENLSANTRSHSTLIQEKALTDSLEQPGIGLAHTLSPSSGKLLIVEGNIGVGKTTLTQKIARELNYKLFLEPATENPFLGEIW